jgi:ABC-type oligopeptide transport system ATPase subunit
MKIIITETQMKHVMDKIMEEYGITYKIYYRKRGYFNGGQKPVPTSSVF